ncbi:MAG: phosphoadenosine phosphosulfate reductase family protein, partial [Fibrobacter sp.]|nr:phosphoadenosine phosphosulfate reductase family protein [Fibrobacter sp.]
RGEESFSRSFYEDSSDGVKNASQLNRMPILDWGAHELWLYIFANDLLVNPAYRKGLSRVGCLMCPESSEKYEWCVDKCYPIQLKPFKDIIIETSSKTFQNTKDKIQFIGNLDWQARKSGVVLNETLTNPLEESVGLKTTFQSPYISKDLFFEWIKTLGTVTHKSSTERQFLKRPNTLKDGIPFSFKARHPSGGIVTFEFDNKEEQNVMLPLLRAFLRKASACVACRSCEANCIVGAISIINGKIKINGNKCIKCRECYNIDCACWRFMSMRMPEKSQSTMVSINTYKNFGLREKGQYLWVSSLVELGDDFFPWNANHPLGNKMVESARNWFIQSGLIYEKNKRQTPLVALFRKFGGSYPLGWDFIWIALLNNSILLKWFVSMTEIGKTYSVEQLAQMLSEKVP